MSRRPSSVARRAAVAPLALALVAGLSACSATNPITTADDYAASDGVRAELDDLRLGNLLVVAESQGGAGTLIGSISNDGSQDVRVSIGAAGQEAAAEIAVDARATVLLTPDGGEGVELTDLPVAPGQYLDLEVAVDGGGSTTIAVPVLDGTLPEYADLVPQPED